MAKTPAKTSKPTAKTAQKNTSTLAPRKLKKPVYHSFRLQKRIKGRSIASAFRVLKTSFVVLGKNWKVFAGLTLLYGVLNLILVQGFGASDSVDESKSVFDQLFNGSLGGLASGAGLFVYLLGASGNTANPTAGAYQGALSLLFSLVFIWALRQAHAGQKVSFGDCFYKSMTPLVPFFLVLLVVGLQFLPLVIGTTLFSIVTSSGIAASSVEQLLWGVLLFGLAVMSLYMLASSIFALYIVTLPGMTPMQALRSARQLVKHRRWAIMRKVVFLPVSLVVLAGLVVIPLILFATPVAPWALILISMLILPMVHSYLYALYRELL